MTYRMELENFTQMMEQSMRVNGSMERKRAREIISFRTGTIMRVNGKMTKLWGKANLYTETVTNIKDNVLLACEMATVGIHTEMEAIMKENGKEHLKKGREFTSTKTATDMKVIGNKALNTEKVHTPTQRQKKNIKEAGKMAPSMVKEHFTIKMGQCIRVNGQMTKDTVKDC